MPPMYSWLSDQAWMTLALVLAAGTIISAGGAMWWRRHRRSSRPRRWDGDRLGGASHR